MSVPPEIASIVAADRAAQREIDAVKARLDERLRNERARVAQACAAEAAATVARLEAEALAIEQDARARNEGRKAERARARESRRGRAAAAVESAVAAYVAIVGGPEARS